MPADVASAEGLSVSSIRKHSHIANIYASPFIRNSRNALIVGKSQNADMDDEEDINGGPNHLGAWMRYRKVNGAQLAKALDITPGMVSDLKNSNRALSAKWLRRIAPVLETTPGMILDHDPTVLDTDVIDMWAHASIGKRRQIAEITRTILKSGTDD